jgi:fused signal recognition particle receptor
MLNSIKSAFQKIKSALVKTSSTFAFTLKSLFAKPLDQDLLDEIEKTLYEADLGSAVVEILLKELKEYHVNNRQATAQDYILCLKKRCLEILSSVDYHPKVPSNRPHVILICGVNGSGKTTSSAKLAKIYKQDGKKVLLGAADTFRAAAIEQLTIWANQLHIDIVKGMPNGDPASCVFDTITKAKNHHFDVAIIDTAGRLESKNHLMQELEKIHRTAKKVDPQAPHATYLVLDATIGQTAIDQIKIFHQYTPISGIILTKLDGTAKGGVILSIIHQFKIPVYYVGTGEKVDDLTPFDPEAYLDGLFAI